MKSKILLILGIILFTMVIIGLFEVSISSFIIVSETIGRTWISDLSIFAFIVYTSILGYRGYVNFATEWELEKEPNNDIRKFFIIK